MGKLRKLGFPLESELYPGASVVYVDPDLASVVNDNELVYEDIDIILAPDSQGQCLKSLIYTLLKVKKGF